jgi:hypothetical protein
VPTYPHHLGNEEKSSALDTLLFCPVARQRQSNPYLSLGKEDDRTLVAPLSLEGGVTTSPEGPAATPSFNVGLSSSEGRRGRGKRAETCGVRRRVV